MSKLWDERPKDLNDSQLIAWALAAVADAINDYSNDDYATSVSLDGIATALSEVGMTQGFDRISTLQYIAERVGAGLERIAEQLEKAPLED